MSGRIKNQDRNPTGGTHEGGEHAETGDYEFRQPVHSDDWPPADALASADEHAGEQNSDHDHARPPGDHQASHQAADAGDGAADANQSIRHHFTRNKEIVQVRHCEPDDLFLVRRFQGEPRIALAGFLDRYGKSAWMKRQRLYVALTSIAAAHEAMHPVFCCNREYIRLPRTDFDGIGLLNCGMPIKPVAGQPPFWICNQLEHCKRCNYWQRVEPAKAEFLPVFGDRKAWYSLHVMCRSNPAQAGVKLWLGEDADGQPVYKWLFRLADEGHFGKLPKFGIDPAGIPTIISEGLYDFMNWLTSGQNFDGLHVFRDISFSFFPDPASPFEVNHTVNPHYHAYGNSRRQFAPEEARRMWRGAVKLLFKASDGRLPTPDRQDRTDRNYLYGFPDIMIRPLATVDALEDAIDYVVKPFKLAKYYIRGLEHGCPVTGLNHVFHQTVFEAESLMLNCPPQGYAFGNMAQKSRGHYIGEPRPKKMSRTQIDRYLERLATGEVHL